MRRFFLLIFAAASLPHSVRATGQAAERLIVGRDTLRMYRVPLFDADRSVQARLELRLREVDASNSTACWRGYMGWWRLDDEGVLWLERIETEDGLPIMTGAELLPQDAVGTRARATWVSGEVRCGDGRTIYYRHDGFMRHDACEWIYTLHDGRVTECRSYRNREYDCGIEPKENLRRLAAAFDTAIASARPERLPAELSLFVKFAADSTGRVVRIDRATVTLREPQTAAGKGESLTVDDPHDPLLAEAVRAFRAETRWKTWWINGAWKEQWYSLPLRRDGHPWQPPR